MKRLILLTLLCFIITNLFAEKVEKELIPKKTISVSKDTLIYVSQDTLKIKIIQSNESISKFNLQRNMPWIGAILLGLLTIIANLLINKQLRISNKEMSEKQINNARDLALAQIENSWKTAQLDFNKTVLSGNRQAWINELRDLTSKILSKTIVMSVKKEFNNEQYEELKYLIYKTELMLNDTMDQEFIKTLKELELCCLQISIGEKKIVELNEFSNKIRTYTKTTLKTEWEKVKRGV